MSSLPKGESMGTKLVELFANRVVDRRNMINNYLRGRAYIESVMGSVVFELLYWFWVFPSSILPFCLALPLFVPFAGFCGFPSRLPSWAFLGFLGLLTVLHGVLDSNFKLYAFIVNGLIKGEFGKPSGPLLRLIVISHWLGEVWIRIWDSFVFLLPLFHSENHVCLSRGVHVAGVAWRAATMIVAGVGDLVQRIGDGRTGWVLGGRAVERSGGAVCGLHLTRED
jgi:hypothetical protein